MFWGTKVFSKIFFTNFVGFLKNHTSSPDEKRSEYRVSGEAISFFQVLSCFTFGVGIDNMNIGDFTAKPCLQLIFKEK